MATRDRKQAYFEALDANVPVVQDQDDVGRTKITDAVYQWFTELQLFQAQISVLGFAVVEIQVIFFSSVRRRPELDLFSAPVVRCPGTDRGGRRLTGAVRALNDRTAGNKRCDRRERCSTGAALALNRCTARIKRPDRWELRLASAAQST